jgi:Doubled CXXCH motif (Paired_CXXCH_1)
LICINRLSPRHPIYSSADAIGRLGGKIIINELSQVLREHGPRIAAGVVAAAFAFTGIDALAGIANTKHNLSSTSDPANVRTTAGTDEICVFCHTPHAADNSAPVPLWNKRLPVGTGYTSYSTLNSSTIDGTFAAVGSVSLACLSCHDGVQAMDNIINAPGSGGFDVTGGGAVGLPFTWNSGSIAGRVDVDGRMTNALTTLSMVGTDLSNDHPISIQYCGGGPSATGANAACRDVDFRAPQNATINSNLVWWVDTSVGTPGTREKTDMILYTRNFAGVSGPSVECASCHDPHVESGTGSSGATFLRIANTGSAVCLACHVK